MRVLRAIFRSFAETPCSEERVRKGAEKLQKFLNAKQQGRLDGFFSVKPKEAAPVAKKGKAGTKGGTKRKVSFPFISGRSTLLTAR